MNHITNDQIVRNLSDSNQGVNQGFSEPVQTETLADAYYDPRTFCRLRFSPTLATGVILSLLQDHFGNPKSIEDPMLQRCVWRNDDDTAIMIEPSTTEKITNIGQSPAILVRRNAVRTQRISIGDKVFPLSPQMGQSYVTGLTGSHTVFNIAARAGQAEALANEVARFLLQFSPAIRGSLCFTSDFRLEEIGQIGYLEGSGGKYAVPVTFSYSTEIPWTLNANLPPIRHIHFKMLLDP
jgi:hypothetical protein